MHRGCKKREVAQSFPLHLLVVALHRSAVIKLASFNRTYKGVVRERKRRDMMHVPALIIQNDCKLAMPCGEWVVVRCEIGTIANL